MSGQDTPLHRLLDHGQSYWLDNLARPMLESGELRRRVEEEGLRGVTSNPAIFSKAISSGDAYDDQIRKLVGERRPVQKIYEELAVRDIRDACDVLRPVYDESAGTDGFVSLEVSPHLARDTGGTIREARRLYSAVDRPNVMIKIPGTEEGLPAIERCLREGINVNVTLLFSVDRYRRVAEAYLSALERRRDEGKSVDDVASVASFFLSRIDVQVDELLGDRIRGSAGRDGAEEDGVPRPQDLLGEVAVANAKIAYQWFLRIFRTERWKALEQEGAHVQRLLWASTSNKDPMYRDVRYVEPLIGPDTVNTMPDRTIEAFADHGRVERTVDRGVDAAEDVLEALDGLGIDLDRVTDQLEDEGIRKFVDPFESLMETLAERRREFLGEHAVRDRIAAGEEAPDLDGTLESLDRRGFGRRLFAQDPTLWSGPGRDEEGIANRLGWVDSPVDFAGRAEEIVEFAREVREAGFDHVVWLGMGGSSLSAEVSSEVFGVGDAWPDFLMLDDTDPEAVRAVDRRLDPTRSLFVVASKSGTTTETLSFYRFFRDRVAEAGGDPVGAHFAAVTDPDTPLAREAREAGFRRVFENPPEIGGRYSALSHFGLVAMALQGVDVPDLLACASQMRCSCGPSVPASANPGLRLGALLGQWGRAGRDKVTLAGSPTLAPLARWLEQLLAESTGKDGTGLVPVAGEPLAEPDRYGDDRVFVHFRIAGEADRAADRRLDALEAAGHPVIRIEPACDRGLGAEYYRWMIATATAGAILGVNPFDEPNVQESKENTRELLDVYRERGSLPEGERLARGDGVTAFGDPGARWVEAAEGGADGLLRELLETADAGDYVALLPYLHPTADREEALQDLRVRIRDAHRVATMLGHGPRYLHSTGQLHKGGPDGGAFVVITAEREDELPIPGADFGFSVLQRAQALGDVRSLSDRGRRVLRLHLTGDPAEILGRLAETIGREPVPA